MREDTATRKPGDRTLCLNRWAVRGLQSILDNWAVFQELRDGILEGKVDSETRGQVIGVQTQMQNFHFFYGIQLLVSEVLKLVKLILTVPATNAASERSCSTLCKVKNYLQSSMAQERLSYCLILATYQEKVDKLKLVKVANQFCFENEHRFSI